jgi:hypothetical protein
MAATLWSEALKPADVVARTEHDPRWLCGRWRAPLRRETSVSQAVVIARHFFRSDGESTSATGAS